MNRLFAIILVAFLSLPVSIWAVDDYAVTEPLPIETEVPQTDFVQTNTLDEEVEIDENLYKQPISKRKMAKKFLLAMAGVVISSLTLFFMLTIYNKIRDRFVNRIKTLDGETSLETPESIEGAVKTFLDKTNWKG